METDILKDKPKSPRAPLSKAAKHGFHQKQTAKDDDIASSILSPIFSLPNEVFLLIFKYTQYPSSIRAPGRNAALEFCYTQRSAEEHKRTDCRACCFTEMSISQVCRLWRALSLGCAELWSTYNYIGREWGFSHSRLPLYLERSRTRLLDLRLHFPENCSHPRILDTAEMLMPHISRWRLLSVHFDCFRHQDFFFISIKFHSAANLRTLESCRYRNPANWQNRNLERSYGLMPMCGIAPKLTCLRMECSDIKNTLLLSSHPITVLQLDRATDMSWEALKNILRLTTLRSLSLSHADIVNFHTSHQPIIAPSLRHFRYQHKGTMFCLWRLLKAPLLELLIIKDLYFDDEWSYFPSMPQENECDNFPSLKTIGLISCKVTPNVYNSALFTLSLATPNVTHLMIVYSAKERGVSLDAFAYILMHKDVIHWENLTTVCYLSSPANVLPLQYMEADAFITQFIDMVMQREARLGTYCTYTICDPDLCRLKDAEGSLGDRWRALQEGKFHEISSVASRAIPEWCLWKPQLDPGFHHLSEAGFNPGC